MQNRRGVLPRRFCAGCFRALHKPLAKHPGSVLKFKVKNRLLGGKRHGNGTYRPGAAGHAGPGPCPDDRLRPPEHRLSDRGVRRAYGAAVRPVPAGRRPPHFLFEQALHRARDPHRAGVVHRHRRRRGPHRPAGPGRGAPGHRQGVDRPVPAAPDGAPARHPLRARQRLRGQCAGPQGRRRSRS